MLNIDNILLIYYLFIYLVPDDTSLTDSESSFDPEGTSPLLQQQILQDEKLSPNGLNLHSLDEELMNRNELKRNSTKVTLDASRKQKEESRSKKLAERLVIYFIIYSYNICYYYDYYLIF